MKYTVDLESLDEVKDDVDEIVFGKKGSFGTWNNEIKNWKYKKYITTLDVTMNHLYTKSFEKNEVPNLKILHCHIHYCVNFELIGSGNYKLLFNHCDCPQCFEVALLERTNSYNMINLKTYQKISLLRETCVDHKDMKLCNIALDNYEREYFDKRLFLKGSSDFDIHLFYE